MELGHLAVGVDLNPGAFNRYVLHGDFHHLVFPDSSFSAVYTNTLDHVFDLPRLVGEITRVLAPGGVLIYETFAQGHETVGRPSRADFLLRPGELLQAFGALRTVASVNAPFSGPNRMATGLPVSAAAPGLASSPAGRGLG